LECSDGHGGNQRVSQSMLQDDQGEEKPFSFGKQDIICRMTSSMLDRMTLMIKAAAGHPEGQRRHYQMLETFKNRL